MYDSDDFVHGDYGNVAAQASVDLDLLLRSAGLDTLTELLALPGLGDVQLPGLGPLLGLLDRPLGEGTGKPRQREVSR